MGTLAGAPDRRNHFCQRLRCQQQQKVLLRSPWTKRPSLQLRAGDDAYSTTQRDSEKVGGYKDSETGEMLSQDEEADFRLYQQRVCDRYTGGEMADRLVQVVDRYMPRVADENRAYVMRYANQV